MTSSLCSLAAVGRARVLAGLALLVALSACGVDGPPQKPAATTTPPPGVSISGEARMGITGRL